MYEVSLGALRWGGDIKQTPCISTQCKILLTGCYKCSLDTILEETRARLFKTNSVVS